MSKQDKNAQNMPGHASRTEEGRLRKIRSDTQIGTLRKRYGAGFGGNVRKDMEWGTYKKRFNVTSVRQARKKNK